VQIDVRVLKTESINWRELKFIQEENFKELEANEKARLKASFLKNGFADPFKVWEDDKAVQWCLDGKHRCQMLEELCSSDVEVPLLLPANFMDCKNRKEAAALVLVYSSQYARITQQGLFDFVAKNDLDYFEMKEQISIPELSLERFEQKFDFFNVNETAEDEDPEFGKETEIVVQPGDIFFLNEHRLACVDFRDTLPVSELIAGTKARIIFCDPPYNLPANFFTNKDEKRHKNFAMGAGEMSDEQFVQFLSLIMKRSRENSVEGAIHYICMDWRHVWHMTEAGRRTYGSVMPKQMCVWNKDVIANGSFYRAKQELVFIFQNGNAKALWNTDLLDEKGFYKNNDELIFVFKNGEGAKHLSHLELKNRIRSNVWNYPSATSTANPDRYELKNHPTPKPVAMVADAILDTTNENDIVIDWFLGSGTSLIAADKTNRICYATEIEATHVQHIIARYYRWCMKQGKEFNLQHINGNLSIENITQTEVAA
jgi:hypothetical protein